MNTLKPHEIVAELDKYIVGQTNAKRMVAVAIRNRWRRQHLPEELREEVAPKNIIMMGPTGCGKTEIARRLARLSGAPFIKVEATKFTEVGYVGRDVESMIRDLVEIAISLVREEEGTRVKRNAETAAEARLMDCLLPSSAAGEHQETREKLRQQYRLGILDDREIELEVTEQPASKMNIFSIPGMEQMGDQMKGFLGKAFPPKQTRRKMKVRDAYKVLVDEETSKLVDEDKIIQEAIKRTQELGIVFIDEIDKIASTAQGQGRSSDISREGVQRDLLPIVEGSAVTTKHGIVHTDHILFIAAGAFHFSKPSDMIPELQGRFPLRVELDALGKTEFLRILKEPHNALTKQYAALLGTESVRLSFTDDGLEEMASFAEEINTSTEDIGARRLYTIMEKVLADISFDAPDMPGAQIVVNRDYVRDHLTDVREDQDLGRYIL